MNVSSGLVCTSTIMVAHQLHLSRLPVHKAALSTTCGFSFLMSYSHPQCHVDVIYDRTVRFAAARSGVSVASAWSAG
jgi:hypothetical protein